MSKRVQKINFYIGMSKVGQTPLGKDSLKYFIIPDWWDKTITIYNKYTDPITRVIKWYRTVIDDCFWQNVGSEITVNNSVVKSFNLICRIPESDLYVQYENWVSLPNDMMFNYFTLNSGDIIYKGLNTFEIDEYKNGSRSTDFLNKFKSNCLEIKGFSVNTMTGVNIPHYRVVGN